jgi:hypothetical protein
VKLTTWRGEVAHNADAAGGAMSDLLLIAIKFSNATRTGYTLQSVLVIAGAYALSPILNYCMVPDTIHFFSLL